MKKKYKVCVFLDNGGHLLTYETDDYTKALRLVEAMKKIFSDTYMVEN